MKRTRGFLIPIAAIAVLFAAAGIAPGARAQSASSAPPESLAAAHGAPADTAGAGAATKGAAPSTSTGKHYDNHLYDKFQLGAFGADVILSSTIRVDNSDGTRGTEIDRGKLGLPRSSGSFAASALWHPGRHHELSLSYLSIGRSGEKTLSDSIAFKDTTFYAGLKIQTKFSAPTVGLNYSYAILAKENTRAGVQLGLGAAFFKIDINAVAATSVGGGDSTIVKYGASESVPGPTVALGLFGQFKSGDHWYFSANGGALGASVDNITVTTWILGGGATYFVSNRFGLRAGYGYSGIKVSASTQGSGGIFSPDIEGSLKYSCQSLSLGVLAAFP